MSSFKSVLYQASPPSLQVLDQLKLPDETEYIDVPDIQTAHSVIHKMQIRGAPLIAIVAVLGLAVDLQSDRSKRDIDSMVETHGADRSANALYAYLQGKMDYLATSRPTAVNLFNALQELKTIVLAAKEEGSSMVEAIVKHAEFMLQRDEADCRAIGQFGASAIIQAADDNSETQGDVTLMTICNTGSLATAAYGTALGIVRSVHEAGKLKSIVALETRPYNQGSRLTAFELLQDQLPGATLICDSMAAYYMKQHHVTACVVGADRVAANGDTANKIGTYGLAVAAHTHGVDFYVAAPFTTLDLEILDGSQIPIEERPAEELLLTSRAPAHMPVWNPAFDVTPAKWITGGIVTEKGIIRPNADGVLDVKGFVAQHS